MSWLDHKRPQKSPSAAIYRIGWIKRHRLERKTKWWGSMNSFCPHKRGQHDFFLYLAMNGCCISPCADHRVSGSRIRQLLTKSRASLENLLGRCGMGAVGVPMANMAAIGCMWPLQCRKQFYYFESKFSLPVAKLVCFCVIIGKLQLDIASMMLDALWALHIV